MTEKRKKKKRRRKKEEKLNERKGQNLDRKNPWQHAKHSRLKISITSWSRLRKKEAQFESSGISVHLDFCASPQYPTVQLQLYNGSVERISFSRVNFLSWLLFRYPFHPRVTAVHVKGQKYSGGRLQLNTHAPYVCGFAWSDMVHGCMVYTERAETVAVSCGTSHVSAVSTPLRILKNAL